MDLISIWKTLEGVGLGNLVVIIVAFLSLVQITPIKINPWSRFFKWVGKLINGEVMDSLKSVKQDLESVHKEIDNMKEKEEIREANNLRNRILRFDDELRRKVDHSEESFNQALDDVSSYLDFTGKHEGYHNAKADVAMQNIKDTYAVCKRENKFI